MKLEIETEDVPTVMIAMSNLYRTWRKTTDLGTYNGTMEQNKAKGESIKRVLARMGVIVDAH